MVERLDKSRPGDVVSDVRTGYDGQAVGAAPAKGDPTTQQRVASYEGGAPVYQTVATTGYDAHGRATSVTDADGNTTTTAFTPATGGPVTKTLETNPLGHTQTTQLDPAWGLPTRQTDANGRITELVYDALGRLTKVWLPGRSSAGSPDYPNLKFSYQVSKSAPSAVSTSRILSEAAGYVTTWEIYDGWLRPRQTQTPAPGGGRIIADTIYDHRGLVEHRRADLYNNSDPAPVLAGVDTVAFPALTTYTYDGAGRATAEVFSVLGEQKWRTTRTYGGDRIYLDPPAGAPGVTEISDVRGNVVQRRRHPGGAPSGSYTATSYDYDAADRLVGITDHDGNQWSYTFDLRGRQVSATDPDAGTTTQTFDALDRLATSTDARGRTLAYTWDALGRKTGLYEGSPSGTQLAEWTYDTVEDSLGMPASSTRFAGGHAYVQRVDEYDQWYRPLRTSTVIPEVEGALAGTYSDEYAYYLDGTLAHYIPHEAGGFPFEKLSYQYNRLGMPIVTQGQAGLEVPATIYSKQGDPLQYTLGHPAGPSHVWVTRTYEEGTRRLVRQFTSDDNEDVFGTDRRYFYNPVGDLQRVVEAAGPDEVECYTRDGHRRLTQVWTQVGTGCAAEPSAGVVGGSSAYWMSYSYTATGLRKSRTEHALSAGGADVVSTYTYPEAGQPRPHAVTAITTTGTGADGAGVAVQGLSYDAAGNTTGRVNHLTGADQTLTWDLEGRLASISEGGQVVEENLYDADGNLLIRRTPEETVLFLGTTEAHLSAEGVVSGVRHYSHNGETIAVRTIHPEEGMRWSWLIGDHQGTAQMEVTYPDQDVLRRYQTPFGVLRTNPTGWTSTRSFVGGFGDSQTGTVLVHLGARDYDPVTGRFLSVDPLLDPADPQSLTGYGYAANNPVTYSDPGGLLPIVPRWEGGTNDGNSPATQPTDPYKAQINEAYCREMNCWGGDSYEYDRVGYEHYANDWLSRNLSPWERRDYRNWQHEQSVGKQESEAHRERVHVFTGLVLETAFPALGVFTGTVDCVQSPGLVCGLIVVPAPLRALRHVDELADAGNITARNTPRRSRGGNCSFAADTGVLMADGSTKPISEIEPGDKITSTDPETGKTSTQTVTAVWVHTDSLVDLQLDTDSDGDGRLDTVTTTPDHPFWNATDSQWQPATAINPGDHLLTPDGDTIPIVGLQPATRQRGTAYNLTVTGPHTYHVTAATNPILAHNNGCGSAAKAVDDLPTVNWGQQSKHFPGHPNYIPGRSALTANPETLIQRAGTGTPVGSVPRGQAGFKERIDFGDSIGTYVSRDGTSSPTSIGILHYRADGSVHIIPGRPQ